MATIHINACITGGGASKRVSAVRSGVVGNILIARILTIPLSAAIAFGVMMLIDLA